MDLPEQKFEKMRLTDLRQKKYSSQNISIFFSNVGRRTFNAKKEFRIFEYYSFAHLYAGEGVFIVPGNKPIPMKAGDSILITPGFLHYYGQKDDNSYFEEDNICFHGSMPEFLFESGLLKSGIIHLGAFRRILPIHELLQSANSLDNIKGSLAFAQLLVDLAETSSSVAQLDSRTTIDQLLYLIWQNPSKWWNVKEMAEFCSLDRDKFRTEFKRHTGILPKDYIDQFKINLAKSWLMKFDWNLEKISKNLGYMDKFHFSRRFKALNNLSPKKFKEAYEAKQNSDKA